MQKYHSDPLIKLLHLLRSRLHGILKYRINTTKSDSAIKLLGCSIEVFKQHLESLFQPGMTWENHGKKGWEIDHIKPCALFDLTQELQQKECFHYSNLQPLWALENNIKSSNYKGIYYKHKK